MKGLSVILIWQNTNIYKGRNTLIYITENIKQTKEKAILFLDYNQGRQFDFFFSEAI